VGSHTRETVLHKLLQHVSFPWAAVLQHGSFPQGSVLQEENAPVWVLHRFVSPASKPAPAWAPLSKESQVLPGSYSSKDFPQSHSLLSGIHLLRPGILHRLQVDLCSTVDLHRMQGDSLPHHGLLHKLQGNLSSGTSSTSSPFFTNLGIC